MNDRRPMRIAQPGMTAWGRAAERDLEAYARDTALHAPDDLADRVMSAIVTDAPTVRVWLPSTTSWTYRLGRLRIAGGLAALILTLTLGGALAVAGASALLQQQDAPVLAEEPDGQPIIVAEPTPGEAPDVEDPPTTVPQVDQPPTPPKPKEHKAVKAADPPAPNGDAQDSDATHDSDRDDEPEATDGERHRGDDAEETEDPGDGSSGSSEGSDGSSGSDSGEGGG